MEIMLISPNFFNYPKIICDELMRMGHRVDWFDDRPSTNSIIKAVIRINKNLITKLISRYFDEIMQTVRTKKYDKILVISGQSFSFTEEMLIKLKKAQPQAEFILYQWDAVVNFKYIESLQKYFDRCYSFDRNDVQHNARLRFLPLFYSREYEEIGRETVTEYKYDVMFVGTAHPKKYKLVSEMSEKLRTVFKNQFIYFFFPSRLVYIYRKILNPEFKKARYSEFNFVPLSGAEMDKLLLYSRCVLDSAQDGQTGLTMRIIEAMGAKRKIITTNQDVVNYDFYRKENIYVYNGELDFNNPFFNSDYKEIDKAIYEKYSLRNWLRKIMEE